MCNLRTLGGAVAVALLVVAASAHAQCPDPPPDIPDSVLRFNGELPQQQTDLIEQYISSYLTCMQTGEPAKVTQARSKLSAPLERGGSNFFNSAYSAVLGGSLSPLLNPDTQPVLVRLNAILVARSLTSQGVVELIAMATEDPSPAVRYWAGSAVRQAVSRSGLSDNLDAQRQLLDALTAAMATENDQHVVQALLEGMSALTHPDAALALLDVLEKRVVVHVNNPALPIDAEHDALAQMFRQLVFSAGANNPPGQATLRKLAIVGFQYMKMAVDLLADPDSGMPETSEVGWKNMIRTCDRVLRWTIMQADPTLEERLPPDDIEFHIRNESWAIIQLRVDDKWRGLLKTAARLQIQDEDLALPEPAPDAPDAAAAGDGD